MLYHLLYPLRELFFPFNLFRYITFRSAYAAFTAFIIVLIWMPHFVRFLRAHNWVAGVREPSLPRVSEKVGTPLGGGILILIAVVIATLLWANLKEPYVWLALGTTLALGGLGFYDDYRKTRSSTDVRPRTKLVFPFVVGMVLAFVATYFPQNPYFTYRTSVLFLKDVYLNFGIFYIIFVGIVITATSNAVNLTDGIDGLSSGIMTQVATVYAVLAYIVGNVKLSQYLNLIYIPGGGELTIFLASMAGASLGFLWYNMHPAHIFMGDTGAMSLGGAIGAVAVLIKQEILLILVGGIFVIEALSVILQVISFKLRGKRIFRMTPLHHHFEKLGWPETHIMIRFWIANIILGILALSTLKIR